MLKMLACVISCDCKQQLVYKLAMDNYFFSSYAPAWNVSSYPPTQVDDPPTPLERNSEDSYSYTIRIINPKKKSSYKTLTWHDVKQVFNSVLSLKAKIAESYPNEVADDLSFQVGYYHGRGT